MQARRARPSSEPVSITTLLYTVFKLQIIEEQNGANGAGKDVEAMIYLDHAATTPLKREVLESMLPYFSSEFANASGVYASSRSTRSALEHAREQVASSIGAQRSEIYFTSGGSEADNWALIGALRAQKGKKRIITSKIEHHAVLNTCKMLEEHGAEVVYVDVDDLGLVQTQEVLRAITPDTAMISIMLANNEVGTIQPVAQIAAIAHEHGLLMHTDAVQAVGHIPVNIRELDVDLLSMSAHKFYGPKGIGALYIKKGVRLDPLIMGGSQERGLRAGTENVPAIVGMGKALELAVSNLPRSMEQLAALRDWMMGLIEERIPGAHINGDRRNRLPGNVHVSIDGMDSALLLARLDMEGIAASAASACSSGAIERSHVLQSMGKNTWQADVRFTIGEENSRDELRRAIDVLEQIVKS